MRRAVFSNLARQARGRRVCVGARAKEVVHAPIAAAPPGQTGRQERRRGRRDQDALPPDDRGVRNPVGHGDAPPVRPRPRQARRG
eukprot:243639-Prymnesium_polylepis.2